MPRAIPLMDKLLGTPKWVVPIAVIAATASQAPLEPMSMTCDPDLSERRDPVLARLDLDHLKQVSRSLSGCHISFDLV